MNIKTIVVSWAIIAMSLCSTVSAAGKNGFLVAPGRLQINVEEVKTSTFIITNTGDERIRLSIEPVYIEIDDPTMQAGDHLSPEVAAEENIVDKVRVSPPRLSLKPGERRDIRVQIRPLSNAEPGDYRAHLLVKMKETAYTTEKNDESRKDMSMKLDVKMETAVAIYGRKGDPVVDVNATCNRLENHEVKVAINNNSAWRFEGRLAFGDRDQQPIVLLRESVRTMRLDPQSNSDDLNFNIMDLNGNLVAQADCDKG